MFPTLFFCSFWVRLGAVGAAGLAIFVVQFILEWIKIRHIPSTMALPIVSPLLSDSDRAIQPYSF